MTGGSKGYHLLRGSSGRLEMQARGLGDERRVVIYLDTSVVRIGSQSTEEQDTITSRLFAGVEGNRLITENKP